MVSDPYPVESEGKVRLCALEDVGFIERDFTNVQLSPRRYSVRARLIDWKAEMGSADECGEPVESALPDFLIEVAAQLMPITFTRTGLDGW